MQNLRCLQEIFIWLNEIVYQSSELLCFDSGKMCIVFLICIPYQSWLYLFVFYFTTINKQYLLFMWAFRWFDLLLAGWRCLEFPPHHVYTSAVYQCFRATFSLLISPWPNHDMILWRQSFLYPSSKCPSHWCLDMFSLFKNKLS